MKNLNLSFRLQTFEGPLDLLLHLIEKNKVNIYDIPIAEITNQYLEYVESMETEDLDLVSEFLVMAATLIDIKSRMLLPKQVNEEGEEEDPRAELVEKLLEYKLYKYISYELKDKQIEAVRSIYKKPTIPDEVLEYEAPVNLSELIGDLTLNKLNEIFSQVIKKQGEKVDEMRSRFGKIEKDEVSTADKIDHILKHTKEKKSFSFKNLLLNQCSKIHVIVTFLAILELIKTGKISIKQDNIFDDIIISGLE